MKISTKTGDKMMTSAINRRVLKDDLVIECLGTLDELQANLMLASHYVDEVVKEELEKLVKQLFSLGEDLLKYQNENKITLDNLRDLENKIQEYEKKLSEQKDFILPGSNIASAHLHLARTVARRLERRIVSFGQTESLNEVIYAYINRLSDLLYIYARIME
jgi:cob(I)alamin adenosyltransferase